MLLATVSVRSSGALRSFVAVKKSGPIVVVSGVVASKIPPIAQPPGGVTLTSSALGSFFYLIVGLHGLHAIAALGLLVTAWWRLQRGSRRPNMFATAEVLWYFVVGVWPVLYWRVYW